MGTQIALTEEQYLSTSFPDIDKEYRDGELVERSLPDNLHSKTQALAIEFFARLRREKQIFVRPELRVKLRPGLYLVPDVSVFHPVEPSEDVPSTPPLIVVDIPSRDDRVTAMREKLELYGKWGVLHVWMVDPRSRRMYTCEQGLSEVPTLSVPELNIVVTPADIFE